MRWWPMGVLLLLLVVAGCSRVTIESDYDHSARFEAFHTFDWRTLPDTITRRTTESSANDLLLKSPLLNSRIKHAVEATLGEKGIRYAPGEETDLHAIYYLNISRRSDVNQWYSNAGEPYTGWSPGAAGYGYRQWEQGASSEVTHTNYSQSLQGTLVIDLIDVRRNTLVWRGLASGAVDRDDPGSKVARVIAKMLKDYPLPGDGGG